MIEDPGSFSGRLSSPKPDLGPEDRNLVSFANFIKVLAIVPVIPLRSTTTVNCELS